MATATHRRFGWGDELDPTKRKAAIAFGSLAAGAILIYWLTGHGKSEACGLTTAAVGVVVADVTKGKGASEIVGTTAAGMIVPKACTSMIEKLHSSPTDTVEFNVADPASGTSTDIETTGDAVLSAPPQTVPQDTSTIKVGLATALKCLNWGTSILIQVCWDGALPPPSGT